MLVVTGAGKKDDVGILVIVLKFFKAFFGDEPKADLDV